MDCMIPKAVAEQAFFCTYLLISIRYNLVKLARDENLAQLMFKGIPDPSVLQGGGILSIYPSDPGRCS